MRNAFRLCLLPALLAALAVPAGPAAAAQGSMDFTVDPAPRSSLDPEGGYFRLGARPGAMVEQAIVLRNLSQRPIELHVAAVDAETGSYGGVSYGLASDKRERVGKWIVFEQPTVRLAAAGTARVTFTVAVPAGAVSGEHLGGITVSAPSSAKTEESKRGAGQAGASLNIQTRRVIAVVVRVPGVAVPRLVVTGVTPIARTDGVYLEIGIANRGGALTKAKGVVSLPGDGFKKRFALDTFVPGTATAYPVKWAQSPREGEHRARVELRYGTRTARWEGTFTIGEKVEEALVERGATGRVENAPAGPLTLVAAAGAAAAGSALLVGGAIWLLSRRRRKRAVRRRQAGSGRDDDRGADSTPPGTDRTGRDRPVVLEQSRESAAGREPARSPRGEERRQRPDEEPTNVAPLVAATAVAVGSALWLLLRRKGPGARF